MHGRLVSSAGLACFAVAALALASTAGAEENRTLHLELSKSAPEADQVLSESPTQVVLWFTQAPQMAGTSVRVVPAGSEPLDLPDATAREDDGSVIELDLTQPLAEGAYQVVWRAMADDGHVVRGDFAFTVGAASAGG